MVRKYFCWNCRKYHWHIITDGHTCPECGFRWWQGQGKAGKRLYDKAKKGDLK